MASIFHVALPDFDASSWLIPRLIISTTAALLLWRPMPLMFVCNAIAHLITLFWLRDVLTQSVLLLVFALVGALVAYRWNPDRLKTIAWMTATTYLVAALHKLNTGFLNPEISCSVHAVAQVADRWDMDVPVFFNDYFPVLTIALELGVGLALMMRSRWYWALAFIFHLPLVVTLAPAFGAVVLCGASAATTPKELVFLRSFWRRRWGVVVVCSLLAVIAEWSRTAVFLSLWQHLQVGWYAALCFMLFRANDSSRQTRNRRLGYLSWGWLLFCLTPYFGLQFQHTGAMLSNLRIDPACHNSLVFSPSLIVEDQYIRLKDVSFGTERWARRQRVLQDGLWNEAALVTMKRNWCVPWARPISMTVTYLDRDFRIADLCQDGSLSFFSPVQDLFSGYQRFQKNLTLRCQQRCIH
ncbi:MAG: hypothetical protein ACPGQS_03570 [Bradymonadia bacterium]